MVFFKPLSPRIKDVILSRERLAAAPRIMISTPSAAAWCSLYWLTPPFDLFLLLELLPFAIYLFLLSSLLPPLWLPSPTPILLDKLIYSVILSQTISTQSLLLSLSKIPSQPIMMKSKLSCILKLLISGSQTMTLGLPPYRGLLASMSPNVLETESRPGNTLKGP